MHRCRDASGLFILFHSLLVIGCADNRAQLLETSAVPGGNRPTSGRLQADTKPFTDLRIPKTPNVEGPTPQDPLVVQTAATAPPPVPPVNTLDSAGPPLKPPDPPPSSADGSLTRLRLVYRAAAQNYASLDSYIVRLRRREFVNGRDHPEELMKVKFRKQPFSVYFQWLGKEGSGREVVYVKGRYEDKIHTLLAAGDMPLMPAGKRMALAPDSIFVRTASRHAIQDTGFGSIIERFGRTLEAMDKGDQRLGSVKYIGPMKRPEFETACEAVEQIIPPGGEQQLPRGGSRLTLFDPNTKFPTLVITQDEAGHEVEYYCFDRFQYPVRLDDDDFNPDKLWPPKKPDGMHTDSAKAKRASEPSSRQPNPPPR